MIYFILAYDSGSCVNGQLNSYDTSGKNSKLKHACVMKCFVMIWPNVSRIKGSEVEILKPRNTIFFSTHLYYLRESCVPLILRQPNTNC